MTREQRRQERDEMTQSGPWDDDREGGPSFLDDYEALARWVAEQVEAMPDDDEALPVYDGDLPF